jgi:hypothetical protein
MQINAGSLLLVFGMALKRRPATSHLRAAHSLWRISRLFAERLVPASPIAAHFKTKLRSPLELTRLWQSDERRQNKATPLSQFLAATLRWLKQNAPEVDCFRHRPIRQTA